MTDTTLPKTLQEAGVATETSSLPDHYSQLDAAEKAAWDMLEDGAASAKTAFHTPVLATVAPDGAPLARTVVLREASRAEKILRANTDQRSRKARDLVGESRAQLHFYDAAAKIQLRATVRADLLTEGEAHRRAWEASALGSRVCYLAVDAPGAPAPEPTSGLPVDADEGRRVAAERLEDGYGNFAIMRFHVEALDWLYLASQGHRRAIFDYVAGTRSWVIP